MGPQREGLMPGCPHTLLPPLPTAVHASRPAGQTTNLVVCFPVSLSLPLTRPPSLPFFKQRNVSLKGSLLPSGTLAPGHPLRNLECARQSQGPLPLRGLCPKVPHSWCQPWPPPCPVGTQARVLPLQRGLTPGVCRDSRCHPCHLPSPRLAASRCRARTQEVSLRGASSLGTSESPLHAAG